MERAVNEFDRARGRMAGDFKAMIADSEDLLKAAASVSGEGFTAARTKFEEKLKRARTTLTEASQPMLDRASEAATATDVYVHRNAWAVVGVAVAAGMLIGFLTAKR